MGSFDVACQVSRLPIHAGDPAVLVPLTYNWRGEYPFNQRVTGHSTKTNDGPMALCYPFMLPIKGTYANYGEIEPDPSAGWDLFTRRSGVDRAKFQQILAGEQQAPDDWPAVCATWIHGEVWDAVVASEPFLADDTARLDTYTLECLGFEFGEKLEDAKRYNQLWIHSSSEQYAMASDGSFSHVVKTETPLNDSEKWVYRPCDVVQVWRDLTDHALTFPEMTMAQHIIERFIAKRKPEAPGRDGALQKLINLSTQRTFEWFGRELAVCSSLGKWNLLELFEADLDIIKPELIELSTWGWYLSRVNTLWLPSYCGSQHGEDDTSLAFAEIVLEVAQRARDDYHRMMED